MRLIISLLLICSGIFLLVLGGVNLSYVLGDDTETPAINAIFGGACVALGVGLSGLAALLAVNVRGAGRRKR